MNLRRILGGAAATLLLGAVIAGPLSADPPSWAGRWKHNPRVQNDRGDRDGRHDGGYGRRDVVLHGVVTRLNMREGTFRLAARGCEAYTVIVTRDTRVLDRGRAARWRDVREGGHVRVEGVVSPRSHALYARVLEGFGR